MNDGILTHGNTFRAQLTDGISATAYEVTLVLDIATLKILDADGASLDDWPYDLVMVDVVPDGQLIELSHRARPSVLLTCRELALWDALAQRGVKLPQPMTVGAKAGLYLCLLLAIIGSIYWGTGVFASVIAHKIPLSYEAKLGFEADQMFAGQICETPASKVAMTHLVDRLHAEKIVRQVQIVQLDMQNAFTFPGGNVVITHDLIDKAQSPDEVAGVLAHEFTHVSERHVMTQFVRSSILSSFWALTIGDFSGLMVVDPSTVLRLADLKFSRDEEAAADHGGMILLHNAHVSTAGIVAFFERIRKETDAMPEWLSNHPLTAHRLDELTRAESPGNTPALNDTDWQALRNACVNVTQKPKSLRDLFHHKK